MDKKLLQIATDAYIKQLKSRIDELQSDLRKIEERLRGERPNEGGFYNDFAREETDVQIENTTRIIDQVKAFRKTI